MFGLTIGRTSRDSFFLRTAGPSELPLVYILVAGSLLLISRFYTNYADWISRFGLLRSLLMICAVALLGVRMLMASDQIWAPHAAYCITESIYTFLLLHFWTTGSTCFNPREGKKAFPIIGAFGLAGVVVGGLAAWGLVLRIGNSDLMLVWSAVLVSMLVVCANAETASINSQGSEFDRPVSINESQRSGLAMDMKLLFRNSLVRAIGIAAIPMWVTVYLTDYLFFTAVNAAADDTAQLTRFLGLFSAATSLVGLVIQLFLTGPLLARFGVGVVVMIHPVSVFLGLLALSGRNLLPSSGVDSWWQPKTATATAAKLCDVSVYNSIAESGTTLLLSVLPAAVRGRCRALKDGVIDPVSIALAGGLLTLLLSAELSYGQITLFALSTCVLWGVISARLKKNYCDALMENLRENDFDLRLRSLGEVLHIANPFQIKMAARALEESDPEMAKYLFSRIASNPSGFAILQPSPPSVLKTEATLEEKLAELEKLYGWEDAAASLREASDTDPGAELLHACVVQKCDQSESKILDLLATPKNDEGINIAAANIRSGIPRHRAEAVELLDSLEDVEAKVARLFDLRREYQPKPGDVERMIVEMLQGGSVLARSLAATFVTGTLETLVMDNLLAMRLTNDPLVHGCALRAINRLGNIAPVTDDDRLAMNQADTLLERILFLRKVPVFTDIDPNDLPLIAGLLSETSCHGGHELIHEGEAGDVLYIVESGSVRVYQRSAPEFTLSVLERGECFGELALLDAEPRSASVESLTPSSFLILRKSDFEQLLVARPRMAMAVIRTLSVRFRALISQVNKMHTGGDFRPNP